MIASTPGSTRADILITVKTYPSPSARYEETVCVAGVRLDRGTPEWARLYPIRFRNVEDELQFKKYDRVAVDLRPHGSADPRIESLRPEQQSLQVVKHVDTGRNWGYRRALIEPLVGNTTTCALIAAQGRMNEAAPSLGLVKPKVTNVDVSGVEPWTPDQLAKIRRASQDTLFGPGLPELEPMPFNVRYHYKCGAVDCAGHKQKVLDWELGEAGRRWIRDSGYNRAREMVREKWEDTFCDPSLDLHLYVGNQHQYRKSFSVLGAWYPAKEDPKLF